jgi:uncharacterized protein YbcI
MSVETFTPAATSSNGDGTVSKGEALSAISRRVVALCKENTGKGPVRVRTYYWNDLLVVLMTGGYTTVETTLLQDGRAKAVMDQRAELQEVLRPHFKNVIEEEIGREVIACMHSGHYGPDFNVEMFVLASRGNSSGGTD